MREVSIEIIIEIFSENTIYRGVKLNEKKLQDLLPNDFHLFKDMDKILILYRMLNSQWIKIPENFIEDFSKKFEDRINKNKSLDQYEKIA